MKNLEQATLLPAQPRSALIFLSFLIVAQCLIIQAFGSPSSRGNSVRGIVFDPSGEPISEAMVELRSEAAIRVERTDAKGEFLFTGITARGGTLTVLTNGYSAVKQHWICCSDDVVKIRLKAAPLREEVVVTASRYPENSDQSITHVQVLKKQDLDSTAALTPDDQLRQVAGFTLFRRTSSRVANPTTQGVSFRGVGSSGASRALVLLDGVPLNDPFGGWIYWDRIPRNSIEQIEVATGGLSNLYGTAAMGGVIQFLTRPVQNAAYDLEASFGTEETTNGSFYAARGNSEFGGSLALDAFRTKGYVLLEDKSRGKVDIPAGVKSGVIDFEIHRAISSDAKLFLRGSVFGESRSNGTPIQQNDTTLEQIVLGANVDSLAGGTLQAKLFGSSQIFHQDFSSVAQDRNLELLTRRQEVPSQQIGLTAQWWRSMAHNHLILAGVEARNVRGTSKEEIFPNSQPLRLEPSGGRQNVFAFYLQDTFRLSPKLSAAAAARFDVWSNRSRIRQPNELSDHSETAIDPRLSILYLPRGDLQFRASVYRAFRAPTLNELYRPFRVGNIFTLGNPDLQAEHLTGAEVGVSRPFWNEKFRWQMNLFWCRINEPIANVTLNITPDLITRQRQNLGRTRSQGIELSGEYLVSKNVNVSAGYQYADARVIRFPANSTLEGKRIPQVPQHQIALQSRYETSRVILGLQFRFAGEQFDDDQNLLALERYSNLDALLSFPVSSKVEFFAAVENLLNTRYSVGRTPIRTLGPPLLARWGFRLRFSKT